MYIKDSPKNGTQRQAAPWQPLDYTDMTDYIRAWPDKLVSFVALRLCDDDMTHFARELYGYICVADREGPNFEEWRFS